MKLTAEINCGDGAVMTIVDPRSFEDGGIGWKLRYGNPDGVRYTAASPPIPRSSTIFGSALQPSGCLYASFSAPIFAIASAIKRA